MKYTDRHIYQRRSNSLIIGLLTLLWVCLSACSSGDDDNNGNQPKVPTKLYIYVYTPYIESSTRAYNGDVNPIAREYTVYDLKIWVFTHSSQQLIGYYASTGTSSLSASEPYELIQLTVDETYAATPAASRERVDVYVLANVQQENCNLTLDETATPAQLEDALVEKTTATDPFGVTNPVMSVPTNVGLPMSGVLRNQPVTGEAPVLRMDNAGEIATVQLIRTVSKIRFAFSRQTGSEALRINSIKLNGSMIPMAEYLFMSEAEPYNRKTCHIKTASGYDTTSPELLSEELEDVAVNDNPVQFAWGTEELTPIIYEQFLDNAATDGYITQRLYYLRESDQMLQGEIKYQIGTEEEKTATFKMVDVGGFSRNHVWTVYVYTAQARIQVVVAETAPWTQTDVNYEFYNW